MYSGVNLSGAISFKSQTTKKTSFYQLNYQRAKLRNEFDNASSFQGFGFKNSTVYGQVLNEKSSFRWGWSNNNYLNVYKNMRFSNYSERSNYLTTFGLAGLYSKRFSVFGRTLSFDIPADVQLLGFFLRPSYISSAPEGFLDPDNSGASSWLNSFMLFYPGTAWNFGCSPQLSYWFESGNGLAVNYQFEFLRINTPQSITQSSGAWFISLITML